MQEGFKSLIVWQKSIALAQEVYRLTGLLPTREKYALADQMRRSAVSVPSNIAEGSRRAGTKEYAHFIAIAHGSLSELETQVIIATQCYPKIPFAKLQAPIDEVSRMLLVLGRRLRGQ